MLMCIAEQVQQVHQVEHACYLQRKYAATVFGTDQAQAFPCQTRLVEAAGMTESCDPRGPPAVPH